MAHFDIPENFLIKGQPSEVICEGTSGRIEATMTKSAMSTAKNMCKFEAEENKLMAACSVMLKESTSFDKELVGVLSETVASFF